MKPAAFDYYAPRSVNAALSLLADYGGDAKVLAGGQSLIPAMNFRLASPRVLVDVNEIPELAYIRGDSSGLAIGAMTRHAAVERSTEVRDTAPLLAQAIRFVAHPAIRTRGTIGGSIAHADPAAELPAVMLALDARFTVRSADAVRTIAATDFFTGLFSTTLRPDELLTEIAIPPMPTRSGFAFDEVSRRHGDFALAGVAAAVTCDDSGRCTSVRVGLLGVGERATLATQAVAILTGEQPSVEAIRAAAEASAARDIDPPGDIHASTRYRRHLAAVLIRRALDRAVSGIQ